jgi:uncharacterized repeat protein (TIGR01451 family)
VGLFLPLVAAASHTPPQFPLSEQIVQDYSPCNGPAGADLLTNAAKDRKVDGARNQFLAGTPGPLAIWANSDANPNNEKTLDVSGSHIIVNGKVVSRSHILGGGQWNLFLHDTEYGEESVSGKDAFLLSGNDWCFGMEPAQVPRNSPTAPNGFPFASQFDPDGNGNVMEHFTLGNPLAFPEVAAANTGAPNGQLYTCPFVPGTSEVPSPLKCDSGKLITLVQNTEWKDGLYVINGDVDIGSSNQTAKVTIVSSGKFKISGSDQGSDPVYEPFFRKLLFASQWDLAKNTANTSDAADALNISGSRGIFKGIVVAPNGGTQLSGEKLRHTCPVMGDRVILNGSKNYIANEDCVPPATLSITKDPGSAKITIGDRAVFDIQVTNTSTEVAAENVVIDDTLPTNAGSSTNTLAWEIVAANSSPDATTKCTITGTGNNILHCNVGLLDTGQSFKVQVRTTTTVTADDCYLQLDNNTQKASADADNADKVEDGAVIDVECGAIRVDKFRKVPGANPNTVPVQGAGFTLLDAAGTTTVRPQQLTDANGKTCFDRLTLNTTFTLRETLTPPGLATAADRTATPTANARCTDNPFVGTTVSIENEPLTDLKLTLTPQIEGATHSFIQCKDAAGNVIGTFPLGANAQLEIKNLKPGDYDCEVTIDP